MKIFKVIANLLFPLLLASCGDDRASAVVLVHQSQPHELYESYLPDPVPPDPVGFLKSDAAAKGVMAAFDYATQWNLSEGEVVEKLRGSIRADFDQDRGVLNLSASGSSSEEARQIVNSFAEAFCAIVEKGDRENRQKLLNSLQVALLEQSDLVQDMRKNRTVVVQQYGVQCFGDLEDSADFSQDLRFLLVRARFTELQGRKELLVERIERYKRLVTTDPSQTGTAIFEEAEKELEGVENEIEELAQPLTKSGAVEVEESLKKLMFQQADQDYQHHWKLLNELRAEQRHLRLLLKIIFEPAMVLTRAR